VHTGGPSPYATQFRTAATRARDRLRGGPGGPTPGQQSPFLQFQQRRRLHPAALTGHTHPQTRAGARSRQGESDEAASASVMCSGRSRTDSASAHSCSSARRRAVHCDQRQTSSAGGPTAATGTIQPPGNQVAVRTAPGAAPRQHPDPPPARRYAIQGRGVHRPGGPLGLGRPQADRPRSSRPPRSRTSAGDDARRRALASESPAQEGHRPGDLLAMVQHLAAALPPTTAAEAALFVRIYTATEDLVDSLA
jgi:hypothetical protein